MAEFLLEALEATALVLAIFVAATIIGFILYKLGLFSDVKELSGKARRGRALAIMVAISFMISGTGKLLSFAPMVEKFTQFNMMHWFHLVGAMEVLVGFVIIFHKTYKLGVLLGTATAGGAVATHLPLHSDGLAWAIPSSLYLVVLWLSAVWYTPEMFPDFVSDLFKGKK